MNNQISEFHENEPDMLVLMFNHELLEQMLKVDLDHVERAILRQKFREYNAELLDIQYDVTIQLEHGHKAYSKQYCEIMTALSQKKLEDYLRYRHKLEPKKDIFLKRIKVLSLLVAGFTVVATSILAFQVVSQYQDIKSNPNFKTETRQ